MSLIIVELTFFMRIIRSVTVYVLCNCLVLASNDALFALFAHFVAFSVKQPSDESMHTYDYRS